MSPFRVQVTRHGTQSTRGLAFGPEYVHEVRDVSSAPAIGVHVYSPPLTSTNRYELARGRPVRPATEHPGQW